MKTPTSYINEALKIGKDISKFSTYSCRPADKNELIKIIESRIEKEGNECNLNDIDTSLVTDMCWLFYKSEFNGNISNWDVSHVKRMIGMFYESSFNGDISNWNTSSVEDMWGMFVMSKFNQDISDWKIKEDCDTNHIFVSCKINKDFKPRQLQ